MGDILSALEQALRLLASGDPALYTIMGRTLLVSGVATLLALVAGVPLGYVLARHRFRGHTLVLGLVNTGMGLPPVVVGLLVWLLLTRSGHDGAPTEIYTR